MLNVYRIGRVIIFLNILNKWMEGRAARYWMIPLSILYLFMFIFIFKSLFPITYPGDEPNPVSGLIAIGLLILYPFYLFFIISDWLEEKSCNAYC
ncbi:hypothetical protein J2T20_000221 [Paenibacillus wynnii]|nr:hypothetical protein [Paenibacillus wynnii]